LPGRQTPGFAGKAGTAEARKVFDGASRHGCTASPKVPLSRLPASRLELHECLIAHAPQPQLRLLVRLAGADRLHGLPALELVGVVEAAVPEHLRDMPAKMRVERLAYLVVLLVRDRLFELGDIGSRPRPTQN